MASEAKKFPVIKTRSVVKTMSAGGNYRGKPPIRKSKKLNQAALDLVNENAALIAKALYDSTIQGHILSARLLVELAEGHVDVEQAMNSRPLRSFAWDLAQEPEWPGESPKPSKEESPEDPFPDDQSLESPEPEVA
jgi:hypothetical protein